MPRVQRRVVVACAVCARPFEVKPSQAKDNAHRKKHCSPECSTAARRRRVAWCKGMTAADHPSLGRMGEISRARSRRIRKDFAKAGQRPLKVCGKCREILPCAEFNATAKNLDGLSYVCRMCTKANKKVWHAAHKSEQNAVCRDYYWLDPAKNRRRTHEWEIRNTERWKARDRRYKEEHAEELRLKRMTDKARERNRLNAARRRASDPERSRETCRRQQAVRWYAAKANPVSYDAVYERDSGICYLCERHVDRNGCHFDHVIPLSKGGSHTYENIRPTHATCNIRKGPRLVAPGAYAVKKRDGQHSY